MIKEVPKKFQEVIKRKIPTGDFGNPENIFSAVQFLINTVGKVLFKGVAMLLELLV